MSCSLTYFETDGFDTPDSTAFDVIKYPLSFSISDSKISDVDIVGLLILDIYFCAYILLYLSVKVNIILICLQKQKIT